MGATKAFKYISWILANISLVIWLIIFLMKISGKLVHWTWPEIFSPLYISLFLIIIFITCKTKIIKHFEYFVWGTISTVCLSVFVIMTSVYLDEPNNPKVSVIYCLIPLWLFLALAMLLRDDTRKAKGVTPRYKNRGLKKSLRIFYPSAIVYFTIYTILQVISSEVTYLSWSVRFIPFFIFIGTNILTVLSMLPKPGFDVVIPSLVSVFLLLLYFYLIGKIGHIAIPFIPIYILIPTAFVLGFFI